MKKKLLPNNKFHFHPLHAQLFALVVVLALIRSTFWGFYPTSSTHTQGYNLALANFTHPSQPVISTTQKPQLISPSYILVDVPTNQILLEQNSTRKIYPASTTKLTTALTALNIYPLNEVITVGSTYSNGKTMGLKSGEKITVKSLVSALLVYSANDAAFVLANHHTNGSVGFISEMNSLIKKYGLSNSNFANFDGIDNSSNYSSAYDLSQIGRLSQKNPVIREAVGHKNIIIEDVNNQLVHQLESTNELLGVVPEIKGLKTGWTPDAGGSFVALMDINGHELISVVTQSDDRFGDTRKLLDWAKANIIWQPYKP